MLMMIPVKSLFGGPHSRLINAGSSTSMVPWLALGHPETVTGEFGCKAGIKGNSIPLFSVLT
jgi:hypothetical protein